MYEEAGVEINRGGYINVIEKDNKKQIDLMLMDEDQKELNKLIWQYSGAYKYGLDIVRLGFYYMGNLYSISNDGGYKITNRDYAEIIKLAFQSEGYDLKEFGRFYRRLSDKNLYNIISTIASGMDFTSSSEDYQKVLDYTNSISEEQIDLLDEIIEMKSKYIDIYFFNKNIIFYRDGDNSQVESSTFKPIRDNEVFYNDYALNMHGDDYKSAGGLFTFPSNDSHGRFIYAYRDHYRNAMLPALHKLFKGKI